MKIGDFIIGRDVQYPAVRQYIRRHPEVFQGHTGDGDEIDLDDTALELLEKKYPLVRPVQVIEDTEARKKLTEVQALVIELQAQLLDAAPRLAAADMQQHLLAQTQMNLDSEKEKSADLEERLRIAEGQIEDTKRQLEAAEEEKRKIRDELEAERSKSWWKKLLGK